MRLPSIFRTLFMVSLTICAFSAAMPANSVGQLVESMATGTTSTRSKQQAIAAIPFRELTPEVAQRVNDVVDGSSLYRQLPVTTIQSDPDLFLYLIRYPEIVVSTWRLMGVTNMSATRTAPFKIHADDGAGTVTDIELVYGTPQLNVYYAEGEYDGPMFFRKIKGKCVLVLQSNYQYDANGNVQVTNRLDVFLKIEHLAASIIAKTVHPLVGTTADHNYSESLRFLQKLSDTTQKNGPGVQRMATRLDGLRPEVRTQFSDVAGVVYQRKLAKDQTQSSYYPPTNAAQNNNGYGRSVRPAGYRND